MVLRSCAGDNLADLTRGRAGERELPEEQQGRLRPLAFQRYRLLKFQKDNEPEFYDIGVKRWETEDRIFALTRELKKADSAHEQEIRQKLRAALGKMFDLRVQERQIRISRLQRQINTEKEQMARETRDREQIISQHLELAEKEHGRLGDEDADATTQPSESTTAPQGAD